MGKRPQRGTTLVAIGSQKLPGAVFLMRPSVMRTARSTTDDMMPRRDVRERTRRGR